MRALSVSEITSQIKTTLEINFKNVVVEGEVSNLTKHISGHTYFSLKDESATISCALWAGNRGRDLLENGTKVEINGYISVYPPRGNYQLICTKITLAGAGNLMQKYEALKKKLGEKGYFENKKKLPPFPQKIAVLTSKTGAVIGDMKSVAQKRWNLCEITFIDTLVQGDEAKHIIARNLAYADKLNVDIIVLARGGGSLEDLWCFNEEIVADAIFRAKTPIVSAIGHEPDYVLSDFVADLRAPTPSACMEIILPDKNEWMMKLDDFYDTLVTAQEKALKRHKSALDSLKSTFSMFKLNYNAENLNELKENLNDMFEKYLFRKNEALKALDSNVAMDLFLQKRRALLPNIAELHSAMKDYLSRKNTQIAHLNEILKVQKLKSGLAQITKNTKIVSLDSLKNGDIIELCDGNIVKNAEIVDLNKDRSLF